MEQHELAKLVKAAQQGDWDAYQQLYDHTKQHAYFVALSVTKNIDDAEDILQDAYLRARLRIGSLDKPECFVKWFVTITYNETRMYLRRRNRLVFIGGEEEYEQEEADDDLLPEDAYDSAETRQIIWECVQGLPEEQRMCVLMHYYEDMAVADIAAALEVPEGTVKTRLYLARGKIKTRLIEAGITGRRAAAVLVAALVAAVAWLTYDRIKDHPSPTEPRIEASTEVAATDEETPTETTAMPYEPKDPTKLSQTELLDYFNDAVNRVRTEKPGFAYTDYSTVSNVRSGLNGGLESAIIGNMMPGSPPETRSVPRGKDNVNEIFGPLSVPGIEASDVMLATVKRSGANYEFTLTLGTENNPANDGGSAYSRIFSTASREDVLRGLGVDGDIDNVTMTYRDGKIVITVNPEGKIIRAYGEYAVDVEAKDVRVSVFRTDISFSRRNRTEYISFVY